MCHRVELFAGRHYIELHEGMSKESIENNYPHLRTVYGNAWQSYKTKELLNVPNPPITVYFSATLLDVNHQFHHAVRRIAFEEHVVKTLLEFLQAARYNLRVVHIEEPQE